MTTQAEVLAAQVAVGELFNSYLYVDAGWQLDAVAECLDEMNDNTRYQSALRLLRQLHEETA